VEAGDEGLEHVGDVREVGRVRWSRKVLFIGCEVTLKGVCGDLLLPYEGNLVLVHMGGSSEGRGKGGVGLDHIARSVGRGGRANGGNNARYPVSSRRRTSSEIRDGGGSMVGLGFWSQVRVWPPDKGV
jgi:hypothetical protein